MTGDEVSEVISQPAPASCIHVPMFDVSEAIQSARKSGWRSGRQVDALIASECRVFVKFESAFSRAIARPLQFICEQRGKLHAHREHFQTAPTKSKFLESLAVGTIYEDIDAKRRANADSSAGD
jgi:hypothetical protein